MRTEKVALQGRLTLEILQGHDQLWMLDGRAGVVVMARLDAFEFPALLCVVSLLRINEPRKSRERSIGAEGIELGTSDRPCKALAQSQQIDRGTQRELSREGR